MYSIRYGCEQSIKLRHRILDGSRHSHFSERLIFGFLSSPISQLRLSSLMSIEDFRRLASNARFCSANLLDGLTTCFWGNFWNIRCIVIHGMVGFCSKLFPCPMRIFTLTTICSRHPWMCFLQLFMWVTLRTARDSLGVPAVKILQEQCLFLQTYATRNCRVSSIILFCLTLSNLRIWNFLFRVITSNFFQGW